MNEITTRIIIQDNKFCQFITDNVVLFNSLKNFLSYRMTGVEYTAAFKNGWSGVNYLMNKNGVFYSGLLPKVREFLNKKEVSFEEVDNRKPITVNEPIDLSNKLKELNMVPRDYQERIVDACFNNRKGIVRACTGSGKCTAKDSLHITEYGLLDYSELQEITGSNLKVNETIPLELNLATPLTENKIDKSSLLYYDGYGPSRKITTNYGFTLTGTPKHKIQIINDSGNIVWKKFKDLQNGDYTIVSFNNQLFGKEEIPLDDAYFYGLLVGDGCMVLNNQVSITNMDNHIINFVTEYFKDKDVTVTTPKNKSRATDIRINSAKYKRSLIEFGFKECKSIHKTLPLKIRKLKKEPLAMVLRGIYETDGWVEVSKNKPVICLALSNKKLIDQIHLLLLNYGIVASRRIKKTPREDSHTLTIYREFIPIFMKEIGLDPKGRKFKLINEFNIDNLDKNSNTNVIPHQSKKIKALFDYYIKFYNKKSLNSAPVTKSAIVNWINNTRNPSKNKLINFINWYKDKLSKDSLLTNDISSITDDLLFLCNSNYYYLPILNIEETYSDNYDFVVPQTHSFVSQGFINHNTLCTALITAKINKPTNIYVIGLDLLQQFHDLFSSLFDEPIGFVGNGICNIQRINIVSVWTVGRALKLDRKKIFQDDDDESSEEELDEPCALKIPAMLKNASTHIFDESHIVATDTIKKLFANIDPERIYGVSGTPYREDNTQLFINGILGDQIANVTASELIERNVLAQPFIKFITVPKKHLSSSNYQTIYKEYIVENDVRNKLIIENAKSLLNKKYQVLILFKTIKHGEILFKMLQDEGLECDILDGSNSLEERNKVKQRLLKRELNLVLASTIFEIGVDISSLSGLVLAGGGRSRLRATQKVGRLVRSFPGKKHVAIIDFHDNAKYLKNHSKIRLDVYESEPGFKVIKRK